MPVVIGATASVLRLDQRTLRVDFADGAFKRFPLRLIDQIVVEGNPKIEAALCRRLLFRELVQAMLHAIRFGNLPADEDWLHRFDGIRKAAMRDLVCHGPDVSLVLPREYIDPLALYAAIDSRVVITARPDDSGRNRYSIGVNPRTGKGLDLRALTSLLNLDESGWGGRQNVIGSPRQGGSAVPAGALQEIVIAWINGQQAEGLRV